VTAGATALVRRFFELNTRASFALQRRLRIENEIVLWHRFRELVNDSLRDLPAGSTFVDLGGGRRCDYAELVPRERSVRLIAVDVSAKELAHNIDADEKIVADVARGLPFADGQIDLLVSRVVFEHIDGVPDAIRHIARVMKPGGRTIHLMPGRNASFALAARWLPFGPLLRALHFVLPATSGHVEFDVHYDHTEPVAIERLFVEAGFRNVTVEWTAAQADYFRPLVPLYLLMALYQLLVQAFGIRRLAAYLIVSAER
jgi:ubiquinone/menaquinone biosynthesis C-methylase UbiE